MALSHQCLATAIYAPARARRIGGGLPKRTLAGLLGSTIENGTQLRAKALKRRR